jgi:hypothetical protein
MFCQPVVVKAFRGIALNRFMVAAEDDVAVITDAAGAASIEAGLSAAHTVGFPKIDVFAVPEWPIEDGAVPNWAEMRHLFPLQQR